MAYDGRPAGGSGSDVRQGVYEGLRSRAPELAQEVLSRIRAISGDSLGDEQYQRHLRLAIPIAIEYGIAAIGDSEGRIPSTPTDLLTHARLAARSGIDLDLVQHGYYSGFNRLTDFVVQELHHFGSRSGRVLHRLLRAQANAFERLMIEISVEYKREARVVEPRFDRVLDQVRRLLAGELFVTTCPMT